MRELLDVVHHALKVPARMHDAIRNARAQQRQVRSRKGDAYGFFNQRFLWHLIHLITGFG